MVNVAPFRATRYADKSRMAELTAPPHDCIRDDDVANYLENPDNICHVACAPRVGGATATESKHILKRWFDDGVMARDSQPAYYQYTITYGPEGQRRTMKGLFCRVALDPDYQTIRRHELTLGKKKAERLELRRETNYDPEPIWMLYRDERGWVDEVATSNAMEEIARFTDEEGMEHRLWRIDRPQAMEEITAQFDDKTLVIADGHHRYQTALNHYAETGRDADASILVCLVRDNDPGIDLLATHRIVRNSGLDLADAAAKVPDGWTVEMHPDVVDDETLAQQIAQDLVPGRVVGLGVVDGQLRRYDFLWDATIERESTRAKLSVTRLHDDLIEASWGMARDDVEKYLTFTRSTSEAISLASAEGVDFVIFLPPEGVHDVLQVAQEGDVMPQKSTYFIPKLRSGIVLSPLDEARPTGWQGQVTDPGKPDFQMPPL